VALNSSSHCDSEGRWCSEFSFTFSVIDGVFVEREENSLKFCRLRASTTEDIISVTKDFRKRAVKILGRDNFYFDEEEDAWSQSLVDESPALAPGKSSKATTVGDAFIGTYPMARTGFF